MSYGVTGRQQDGAIRAAVILAVSDKAGSSAALL